MSHFFPSSQGDSGLLDGESESAGVHGEGVTGGPKEGELYYETESSLLWMITLPPI